MSDKNCGGPPIPAHTHHHEYPIVSGGLEEHSHIVNVKEPTININLTAVRKMRMGEIVGMCIHLLSKRTFLTEFPVFEEIFAKDLREAIWKVLDLHAGHLHMKKED